MSRLRAFFIVFMLFCPVMAHAADINADGAAHLQAAFSELLDYQKNLANASGQRTFQSEGGISVEPTGTYYAVTLPHVSLLYKDGRKLEIGMVSINAAPGDHTGEWKMSIALPTPMTLYNAAGTADREINIGTQRAAGLWREDMLGFTKLDAHYQNVTIDDHVKGSHTLIPQAAFVYNLNQGTDGMWSGPMEVALTGAQTSFDATKAALTIGAARIHFDIQSLDSNTVKDTRAKILGLLQAPETKAGALEKFNFYSSIFDLLSGAVDGIATRYEIDDITLSKPATNMQAAFNFHADSFKSLTGLDGLRKNRVNLNVGLNIAGLQTSTPNSTLPHEANVMVSLENVPFHEISDLAKSTMQASIENPEMAQIAGLMLISKIPAILSQSGASLKIPANYLGNDNYRIDLDGAALADVTAVNSITAQGRLAITGLDWLMTTLQNKQLTDPVSEERRKSLLDKLNVFKSLAKPEQRPDGKTVQAITFEMNKAGKILLNGQEQGPKAAMPPSANMAQPH